VNNQQDIMSVCLAVVRGILTPAQAKEAILGRTTPEPVRKLLRLAPELDREAADLNRLPVRERDECLDLFKDLYSQPPGAVVLQEDEHLAELLLGQRLISSVQAEECRGIQRELLEKGVHPLPRLGELLIRKGFLVPGKSDASVAGKMPDPLATDSSKREGKPPDPIPPEASAALLDSENRFGRYVRTGLLGQGGVGEVWKSWDLELQRWVALKFLKFEDTEELARLKREAQTAARLSHPGIAAVFEIAEAQDRTFLVLEFIDGQTLETYPRNDHRKLVSLVREASLAIHYAHGKGVIHRDLKPGNIMVDSSGRVLVMDFGLARQIESKHSISGLILGTPAYMSPEQAVGNPVDVRSDVYSLGATLYELLSDRPPFRGKNVYDTVDKVVTQEPDPLTNIAEDLRTVVSKCLMKEASQRYPTALDLAEDLRRWLEGEAILAHPPSVFYRLRKKAAKGKAVLLVGLAGILIAAGIAGWAIPGWLKADRAESLKELELAEEKAGRAKEERALELARPHLDEGRKLEARLDRLLTTETWTPKDVLSLVEQAQKEFDRVLAFYPNHPDALLEKARILQYAKHRTEAIEYCSRAIEASRGYATAYLQRARLMLEQYEELRQASGRYVRLQGEVGKTLAEGIRGDLKEVQAWSKDAREITFAKGALAFVDEDYESAARMLEDYSQMTLSDYRGWEWTAHAWLRVPGMEAAAIRALNEALKYRPRLPTLLVFRGTAYLQESARLKRGQEMERAALTRAHGVDDFRSARDCDPMDARAHQGLGEACLEAGEGSLAAAHFSQALGIDPKSSAALVGRARARLRQKDATGASADADEAIRLGSSDPKAYLVRGRARCAREDLGGAVSDLNRAHQEDPLDAEAVVGLGDVKQERGDVEGAIEEYARAVAIDPSLAEAYHHRGNSERDQGLWERAIADLTKALHLDPGNPWIYYDRGVYAGNRNEWQEALADFRKGLARMPSDSMAFRFRIWLVRARIGDAAAAREELAASMNDQVLANPDSLSSRILALLLDRLSTKEFLKGIEGAPGPPKELAQAYFYAGEKALFEGDKVLALDLLTRCVKLKAITAPEYSGAEAELRSLPHQR
jgi:tetratricopeptide (TPR) repeat protein/predicted Ser/Thr protein kinase